MVLVLRPVEPGPHHAAAWGVAVLDGPVAVSGQGRDDGQAASVLVVSGLLGPRAALVFDFQPALLLRGGKANACAAA